MGMPDAEGQGSADGLPGLPPEWGRIVVPDDPSALAEEAARVRRELRRQANQTRWRRRLGLLPRPDGRPPLRLPLLVLLVTLLITLAGLFAVTWPRSPRGGDRPTVIILVDACPCPERVAEAAALAPPGVTVVTVEGGRTVHATPASATATVRPLADPAGGLRTFLRLPAQPGAATALLVDRAGVLVRVVAELRSAEDYRADLARLGT
ncbi:hypothetical protein QLR68_18945 [Micromonospora sp. DH15]|nr:hypothetical protein [Micromonospora sp. DH15]